MTNIDIVNGLIFQALQIKKDTFDDRLLSQKKIFLLQELGVDIGYSYNWYIRGPYSPDLTDYIFNNLDMLKEQDFSKYRLADDVCTKIEKVNHLVQKKPDTLSIPSWYELLASVLYIHKTWKKGEDNEKVYSTLVQYKPQYTAVHFQEAVSALESLECYA